MSARFWWVNHSPACPFDLDAGYLWFGRRRSQGKARSESDRNVLRLLPGDVVFSFAAGSVAAVGVVLGPAREALKPAELAAVPELSESDLGWLVSVRFMAVPSPLRTDEHLTELAPVIPRKHSPILATGAGNQHVTVATVPPAMVTVLSSLLGGELERIVSIITEAVGRSLADDVAEALVQQRTDIGPRQKADLLKARHGQGLFRTNIELHEQGCRVTGLLDRRHLRATHIKPWWVCDDSEMLDGSNGLLMAPHVAHLFERGYVSFSDAGELLVSQELNPAVIVAWSIEVPLDVGEFTSQQCHYLDYHRHEIFEQHGGGRRQNSAGDFIGPDVPLDDEPAAVAESKDSVTASTESSAEPVAENPG